MGANQPPSSTRYATQRNGEYQEKQVTSEDLSEERELLSKYLIEKPRVPPLRVYMTEESYRENYCDSSCQNDPFICRCEVGRYY